MAIAVAIDVKAAPRCRSAGITVAHIAVVAFRDCGGRHHRRGHRAGRQARGGVGLLRGMGRGAGGAGVHAVWRQEFNEIPIGLGLQVRRKGKEHVPR